MKYYFFAVGINVTTKRRSFLVAPAETYLDNGQIVETDSGRYRILYSSFQTPDQDTPTALALYSGGKPERILRRITTEVFEWEENEDV